MFHDLARTLGLSPIIFDASAAVVILIAAFFAGFITKRLLHRSEKRFENSWGELIFALLESLCVPLALLGGLYAALEWFSLPPQWEHAGSKLILLLVIAFLFRLPARVFTLFLRRVGQREPALQRVTQPATFLVNLLFALVAAIIILENLGVHLTAVWTTLGIGSVAVALALQETLSNSFAGLYLLADRPVNPGDYIKLDSGQEGYVVRIGWRSTQLRTLTNTVVVMPNSTLAKAIITNYSMPEPRMSLVIPVGVAYGTDPSRVEKILLEIAQQAAREGLESLLTDPPPIVRLIPGFGPSSLDFSLIVQVREFRDQFLVQSELRKRILARFAQENITMPFPTQSVLIEKAGPGS